MTNIMKEKPMAAIHERAMTFVSKCAEAGQQSVDVYVRLEGCPNCQHNFLTLAVFASLLCSGLRNAFHVQPWRTQISECSRGLRDYARDDLSQ
jgi:hypothetical protein